MCSARKVFIHKFDARAMKIYLALYKFINKRHDARYMYILYLNLIHESSSIGVALNVARCGVQTPFPHDSFGLIFFGGEGE